MSDPVQNPALPHNSYPPATVADAITPSGVAPLRRGWLTSSFWLAVLNLAGIWLAVYQAKLPAELAAALTATLGIAYQYLRNQRVTAHADAQAAALSAGMLYETVPAGEQPALAVVQTEGAR